MRSSEDIRLLQNKPTSANWSIFKTNEEDYEGKESAREDPTIDEYQDMKGKKEDDNGKTKFIKESMHANQFTDLLVHVELEQLRNYSKPQSMPVKETERAWWSLSFYNFYMIRLFQSKFSGGFMSIIYEFPLQWS